MQASSESLSYYVKHYARYIIPTWLFPVYFIAFGLICEHFNLRGGAIVLFIVLVGPVFYGTFFWSRVRAIPRFQRWILTMFIPFLIFAFMAILLAAICDGHRCS